MFRTGQDTVPWHGMAWHGMIPYKISKSGLIDPKYPSAGQTQFQQHCSPQALTSKLEQPSVAPGVPTDVMNNLLLSLNDSYSAGPACELLMMRSRSSLTSVGGSYLCQFPGSISRRFLCTVLTLRGKTKGHGWTRVVFAALPLSTSGTLAARPVSQK